MTKMKRKRDPHGAAASPWHVYHEAGDMAEVPVTCLLGSLGPLLHRLQVLMDTEGNLPKGVSKSDLRSLRRDLEDVSRSVMEISREENPHFTDKLWVNEVRELSYDAEDYLDMVLAPASRDSQIPWIQKRRKGPRIAKDISDLRSRLQQARDRRHRYQPAVKPKLQTEHIGLEEPMATVVNLLDFDREPNLKVVPIFGVAGVGKTTLATRLYHLYGGSFQRRAFLRVSRKPDIRRLLTTMLSQIKGPKSCTDVQGLIKDIRKCLDDKSYFIVFDDLWDTSVWDIIRNAFPARKCYSRIITTTEIEKVALACCSNCKKDMYTMDPLNPYEAQKLLLSRSFGSKDQCGSNDQCAGKEEKDVSDSIIRNSDGLPLAIVPIASMLASWSKNEMGQKKKYIQESLRLQSTSEWMKDILNLVYSDLPDHLKTCLLYFNMYPEDYVIRKDDVVKQWVAEGFLTSVKLQDMEQVAGTYFDELVTRGMIQPLETNYNDEVLSCAVHHMVVDLIAQKSTEQNFITVMYYNATVTGHPDKVRRLSLKFGAAESAQITWSFRMSQVRSLIFSGFYKCVPSLVEYRLLHVLILHIWTDQDKTSFNLAMIQEMFRLRYLKVECNMTVKLPASIARLQCLGTMEIQARVAAIPSDIVHLQRLLHLRLPSGTDLPHGIGHMTSLRSLSYFNISTSSRGNVLDLRKLTNLQDLHLSCSRVRSKRLHSNMKLLASILGSINLRSLTLDLGASSDESIPSEGLSSLSSDSCPPILLERLKLSPGICIFFHIPKWVGELSKLCVLKIAVKEMSSDDVDMLKGLPALSALSLYVQVTPKKIVIDEKGFSVLKNFKFICRAPPCMEFMSGAMPTVRRLKLGFSAYQIVQCRGLEHLKNLSVVYAKVERAGVDDSGRKAIQSKLKDIFKASPVVNVIWVDRVFGNKDTHPGVRTTMSSSESSSCTTNPGTQNEVEDIKIKRQKKNHQCYRKQRENAAEDSEEYTIPENGLGVSARTGLSKESSPCQQDQEEIISELREHWSLEKHGAQEISPEEEERSQSGSRAFMLNDSSSHVLEPEQIISELREHWSPEKHGAHEISLEEEERSQSGSSAFMLRDSSSHVLEPELRSGPHVLLEIVDEAPPKFPVCISKPQKVPTANEHDITTEQADTRTTGTDEEHQEVEGQKEFTPTSSSCLMLELRKYILLLASLMASATYAAGFSPPWGFWQETGGGHIAGDPIFRNTHKTRYIVFFNCNAAAFAVSLVTMVLIVIFATMDHKGNNSGSKIVCYYRNRPWISVQPLQAVMLLDLFCLMGAYAAGSSWDRLSTSNTGIMVIAVVISIIIFTNCGSTSIYTRVKKMVVALLNHFHLYPVMVSSIERGAKEEESLDIKERSRKVRMLLASFAVSTTYVAGFSTPGGVWDTTGDGQTAGDPILKDSNNLRLQLFFYFNTTAFIVSVLTIMELLERKVHEPTANMFLATMLIGLVGSYSIGSSRQTNTTVHIVSLLAAVLVYILFIGMVAPTIHAIRKSATRMQARLFNSNGRKQKVADNTRTLVVLFATLTATVTYQAGLHPPGGIWQETRDGHKAGDPILLTTNARQYKAFLLCNSISFVASLVTIILDQKKLLFRKWMLETVMILDLCGLIGAYTAGLFWDPVTFIYIMLLASGALAYVVIAIVNTLYHTRNSKEDVVHVLVDKTPKRVLLLAILVATITYQTSLNPPGGFVYQDDMSGHKAAHPVLLYNFPRHYKIFIYCNSVSFMASITFIVSLFVIPNLYKASTRAFSAVLYVGLSLMGLISALATGSSQHLKTSIYVYVMEAAVLLVVILLFTVHWFTGNHTATSAAVKETNTEDDGEGTKRKRKHRKRKYLMLLGILLASATYTAGLQPPGGAWKISRKRFDAGNPIMLDIRRHRYLTFLYSNSISFVASVAIILLVLVPDKLLGKHKAWRTRWPVVMNATVVLDLLGLLVAYAAGSARNMETFIYFYLLVMIIVFIGPMAYLVIHSGISNRNQESATET